MTHTQESLAQALISRQLLPPDAAALTQSEQARPWFIAVVLGFAGWLAGFFTLGFLSLLFELDDKGPIAVLGTALLGGAFALYRLERDNPFVGQLALALSIAGQAALVWSIGELTDSPTRTVGFTTLLQLAVLWVMPNHFARTLAALFACIAWALTMRFLWFDYDTSRGTQPPPSFGSVLGCWLVAWIPLLASAQWLVKREVHWVTRGLQTRARPALTGILASLGLATWITEPFNDSQLTGFVHQSLVLWPMLAVLIALLATYWAFRVRQRALLGLAVFGALLHVAYCYYLLGTTLLIKACVMMLLGVALLLAARLLRKRGMQ